jgi:hypothetical protein
MHLAMMVSAVVLSGVVVVSIVGYLINRANHF